MLRSLLPESFAPFLSTLLIGGLILWSNATPAQDSAVQWTLIEGSLEIGTPIQHEGLQVFPIRSTEPKTPKGDVLSLREALAIGAIQVVEQGEGNVPELTVVNAGKKPVLLAVGDVVQGGRQDRVIVSDAIIPPSKQPVTVAVNCVEAGRWSQGAEGVAFSYGGRGESGLKKVLEVDRNQQSTWGAVARLNEGKVSRIAQVASADYAPAEPAAGPGNQAQIQVQGQSVQESLGFSSNSVPYAQTQMGIGGLGLAGASDAAPQGMMELRPTTGTYMASLGSSAVSTNVQPYLDALEPILEEGDLVGLVAALDGKVISAEVYGDTRLFRASSKDMIRALSLDALSRPQGDTSDTRVNTDRAASFLRSAMTAPEMEDNSPHALRTRRATEESDAFETKDEQGGLLHMNVYAH